MTNFGKCGEIGGSGLLSKTRMDILEVVSSGVQIDSAGTTQPQNASFWSAITAASAKSLAADGSFITMVQNTTEQTIIDESGVEGVLTNVICPSTTNVGDFCTVRVTTDGTLRTFITPTSIIADGRGLVGFFKPYSRASNDGSGAGAGANHDLSWNTSSNIVLLQLPREAVELGYGISYTDSIKVTIQVSASPSSASLGLRTGITRVPYLHKD
ncbi:MAG: hypothetical protein JKY89_10920 [Immundisolibacteraceae bacterium]|nr:hypothetical protein [Immundisolibacteraceae bacterium]